MKRFKVFLLLVTFVLSFSVCSGCTASSATSGEAADQAGADNGEADQAGADHEEADQAGTDQGEADQGDADQGKPDYDKILFDTGFVHTVNVSLSGEDWDDLLANPTDKTKYKADIEIDGETVENVAFATKGNSSLFIVAADTDSSRYSYRVNFGKYEKGQTWHGLDKLSLNNNFSDATLMKDYFCYEIFREAGVPAPLTSYVWLTVNGEDRGLYLAVEDLDESFLGRINDGKGVIYKPQENGLVLSLGMIDDMKKYGLPAPPPSRGADLVYKDDDPGTYPDIFEHIETDAEEEDNQAVIAAMKGMAEGTDLESCLDTDEIIRYFAAHNFVLNYDSYTGTMLHNLILLENEGRLSVLPWDYNAAFGAFIAVIGDKALEDATDILNRGIDSPLIGAEEDGRPLWRWIAKDDNYTQKYHDALDKLVTDYFESGRFEREVSDLSEMLRPYVEKDPTAFFSADEYKKGCETLKQFGMRRAQSIRKQLSGSLASRSDDQSEQDKVDASDLHIMAMGASVPAREEKEAEAGTKIETVRTGTFSMDYFKFGQGNKTLVILPGLSVQSVMGFADAVVEEYGVFAEDYTVYVFDRRNDLPADYSVEDMARDTAEAVRALGLKDIDLLGASQGGMIALAMAISQPDLVHKLALASSSACVDEEHYRTIEEWARLAEAGDKEGLYLKFGEAVYPAEVFDQSKDLLVEAAKTVTEEDLKRFVVLAEGSKGFDVTGDLEKITCPVLVIGSLDDQVLGSAASVQIAENLRDQKGLVLYLYDGYGHAAYDTAPDYRYRLWHWFRAN